MAQLLSTLMEVSNAAEGVRPPPTALYAAWDGLALLWEAVMSEAYPLVEANFVRGRGPGVTLDVLKQCFEAALKFDSQDPQLLMSELTVLGSLLPCLRLVPEGMAYVLHKLFAALEFNAEQDRELQERNMASGARQKTGLTESAQVRRKAGMLLVQLCSKPPPCFIDSLDTVLQRSHALLSQPSLAEMTHNQLVAALASSLNALPDPQLHTRYLDEMSRPFVADWLSADMTALLSNPEQFIEAAALMSPGVDALALRRRVVLTLTALQTILQNTQPRGPDGKLLATSSIESLDAAASAATGSEGTATGGKGKNKGPAPLGSGGARGTSMSPAAGRYSRPLTPDAYPSADLSRACVRNALVLCQTLHWLWTPDSPLAQSAFSALLELRRSDMYAALSRQLDMASISREMTADELWLDRTQLWLATLREAAYCLVQQAARQGTLFESAELIQLVQSCALQGLPSMQKRHLKLIVRHIIDPTLRYCPRLPDVMAQVLPVVAGAYQGVVDALLLFWDAKRQAVKAGAGGGGEGAEDDAQTNGGLNGGLARAGGGRGSRRGRQSADAQGGEFLTTEQREILEDKALQDVTEVLLRHIEQLLTTQGAAAAAAGGKGGGGGGSSSSGGAAAGASVGSLDELAALVMHTDASALPIIRFLCATATVPSSLVAGKAVTALTRLVLTLGSTSGAYRGLVAQHVLPTALESLSIHGEHSDNQSSLLMLVLRCIEVAHQEPVVGEVLSRVPGATPQALAAILQVPPSGRGADGSGGGGGGGSATVAQRQQRQLLRQFLQPIMGVNIGQAWKDDVRVRDLPERLFLAKATENNSEEDDGVAGEIFAAVFDS